MAGKGKNQHVVKRDDGWAVRGEGNSKDTSHHRTQHEAADAARAIAASKPSLEPPTQPLEAGVQPEQLADHDARQDGGEDGEPADEVLELADVHSGSSN